MSEFAPIRRLHTELLIDGEWIDVTPDVREEDAITLTRGRTNERPALTPATMQLALNDTGDVTGVMGGWRNNNPLSPHYRKLGRGTQIRIGYRPDPVADSFGRTVAAGWGTVSTGGQAWTDASPTGMPGDLAVSGGRGTHSVSDAGQSRISALTGMPSASPIDMAVTVALAQATGGDLEPAGLIYRATSTTAYGLLHVAVTPAGAVTLRVYQPGNATTPIATATVPGLVHTGTGQPLRVRVQAIGRTIRGRCWPAASVQPTTWHITAEDASTIQPGWAGIRSGRAVGNTNAGPQFAYDNFEAQPVDMRAWLEVPEWTPDLDPSGELATMQLGAAGLLSRLAEGSGRALRSPIYRYVMGATEADDRIAYWPIEDPSGSLEAASAVDQVPAMSIIGKPALGAFSDWPGSDPVATLPDGSGLVGTVIGSTTTATQVSLQVHTPTTDWADGTTILSVWTSGSTLRYDLRYGTGGTLSVRSFNTSYAQSGDSGAQAAGLRADTSYWIALSLSRVMTNVNWTITVHRLTAGPTSAPATFSGAFTLQAYQSISQIKVFPQLNARGAAVGHIAAGRGTAFLAGIGPALSGFNGESCADRFRRLCGEAGIAASVIGEAPTRMGIQTSGTLVDMLAMCASTDGGAIYDSRDHFGLEFRSARSMYNQSGPLVLDYEDEMIAPSLRPVEDMSQVANSVTVVDPAGRSATAERATGAMSTAEPPAGIGVYEDPRVRASTYLPSALQHVADWRLAHGTYEADRWPGLRVRLHSPAFDDLGLRAQAIGVDVGDLIVLRNLPSHYSYDDVRLILQGWTETITGHSWELRCNTSPGDIWSEIGVYDDPTSLYDSATSSLTNTVSASATSFSVTTTDPRDLWVIGSGLALPLRIAGETVTVDTITGAASPQVFSNVTRAVNGVSKALPAGSAVHLARPARYGL